MPEKWMHLLITDFNQKMRHQLFHLLRKRSSRQDAGLRPTQTSCRDHLHGFGDLLRRLNGLNLRPDFA